MDKISMLIDQLVNVMVSFGPFGGFLLVLLESVFILFSFTSILFKCITIIKKSKNT